MIFSPESRLKMDQIILIPLLHGGMFLVSKYVFQKTSKNEVKISHIFHVDRGIFILQNRMRESRLKEMKFFSELLASEFIDANPQAIWKSLILSTSSIHFACISCSQYCSKIKRKCMGEVHHKMIFEYLNLCGVLPHLKPWRLICWSPSNSPKKESYGPKYCLQGKSDVYYNKLLSMHLRGFERKWIFFLPYLYYSVFRLKKNVFWRTIVEYKK